MKSIITICLLFIAGLSFAQQPPCGNNPAAGNTCSTAVPICDLNGYCGNTSSTYSDNSWGSTGFPPFISGSGLDGEFCGSIENNSFINFIAENSAVSLDVWVGNCTAGNGIQIMVFQSDGACSGDVDTYYCNGAFAPAPGNQPISITGLTPGETYILMIDGNAGDVCDYAFTANSGISIPVQVDPVTTTLCIGETVNLNASGGDGTYTWDASPDLSATTGSTVTATPPTTPGTYTYTVNSNSITACPIEPAVATVIVEGCGCPIITSNTGPSCIGDVFDLEATIASGNMTTFSWSGPNGFTSNNQNPTGVTTPTASGSYDYTFTATIDGVVCTSVTTINISNCAGSCDAAAIRSAFVGAGCVELDACISECSMYFLNPQTMSGNDAQTFAEGLGANLVSVQTQAENDCILSALNTLGETGTIWIGLNDEAVEGTFVWYDQSPVTYTNWAAGEPNNSGGDENCVQIYPTGAMPGMWNDLACSTNDSKSIIEVNLCPVVDAGPNITICEGETATMQSNATILGSQPYTYQWNNSGPSTLANSVTPASTTDYVLRSEDRYSCNGTDTMTVVVNQLPTIDAGADQSICVGTSVTLNATGGAGTWDNGVTNGVAFVPTATQTYTYTATINGCTSSDDVTIEVNPAPTVSAGNDVSVCSGVSVTLNAAGSGTWNNGITNGVSFVPTATQTYTYTVSTNGCVVSDDVTVTVKPIPNVNAGNDVTICEDESVILSGTGGAGSWNNGVTDGVAFTPSMTQTYTYTVTTNGCTGSDDVTAAVLSRPNVGVQPSDTFACGSLLVDYSNLFMEMGVNYTINFGDGSTAPMTDIISHEYTTPGCYDVTLTADLGGCINDTTYADLICITEQPIADFTPDPQVITIIEPFTTFNNSSNYATDYIWDFGDGSSYSTENSPSHTYPDDEGGSYIVTLIASSDENCSDTAEAVVVVEGSLIYYIPNSFTPDGDIRNPEFKPIFTAGYDIFNYKLLIFNRWGEVVFESNNSDYGWNGTFGADSNKIIEGTYIYKIEFKTTNSDERKMVVGHVNILR